MFLTFIDIIIFPFSHIKLFLLISPIDFSQASIVVKGTFIVKDRGTYLYTYDFTLSKKTWGSSSNVGLLGGEAISVEKRREAWKNNNITFTNLDISSIEVFGICPSLQLQELNRREKANEIIRDADDLFSQGRYEEVKAKYQEASNYPNTKQYASQKLNEINKKTENTANNSNQTNQGNFNNYKSTSNTNNCPNNNNSNSNQQYNNQTYNNVNYGLVIK